MRINLFPQIHYKPGVMLSACLNGEHSYCSDTITDIVDGKVHQKWVCDCECHDFGPDSSPKDMVYNYGG